MLLDVARICTLWRCSMVFPNSELDRLTGYGTSEVSVELLPRATIIGVGLEGAKHSIGPWLAYVDQRSWRWTCGSARYSMCDQHHDWFVVWNILYFSIYWECHHPNWRTHIFQRGWNHQPDHNDDIRIYRNLNSSWQYYTWVYAYLYAIISGILPNSQQSFWGKNFDQPSYWIYLVYIVLRCFEHQTVPSLSDVTIFSQPQWLTAESRWTKMDWLVLLTSLPLWRSDPQFFVQQKSSCFSRSQTWDLTYLTSSPTFFSGLGGSEIWRLPAAEFWAGGASTFSKTVRWLWWSIFLLEFWHFGGVQLMFYGWVTL